MKVQSSRHTYTYKKIYTHTHASYFSAHTPTHTYTIKCISSQFKLDETQHLWDGERFCLADKVELLYVCVCVCLRAPVRVCAYSHKAENQFLCCQLRLAQPAVISLAASLLAGVPANKINLKPKGNWHFQ